jgi:hypothetical protein
MWRGRLWRGWGCVGGWILCNEYEKVDYDMTDFYELVLVQVHKCNSFLLSHLQYLQLLPGMFLPTFRVLPVVLLGRG